MSCGSSFLEGPHTERKGALVLPCFVDFHDPCHGTGGVLSGPPRPVVRSDAPSEPFGSGEAQTSRNGRNAVTSGTACDWIKTDKSHMSPERRLLSGAPSYRAR